MGRKIFVVTAAYGHDRIREMGGQTALLPMINAAGADGVEIRRELMTDDEIHHLAPLAQAIAAQGLLACYSAPQPLFTDAGELNPALPMLLNEARALDAQWLKVSLGHFTDTDAFPLLQQWLAESDMRLVVENDQTACGELSPMQRFSAACQDYPLPVSLTFDTGNWLWVGASPEEAAQKLASGVSYIHVKGAEVHGHHCRAIPPNARWLALLNALPADAPRGIEFPLEGADLLSTTAHYVSLLRKESL